MSTSEAAEGPVAALAAADRRLSEAEAAVDEVGAGDLRRLREAHGEFTDILARYEEPATGDGDFELFIEFQGRVADFVEGLPGDLLRRETFEACDEHLQQRRLSEGDFAHVREQLEPVADLVGRLDEREDAREAYRRARQRVQRRRREVEARIEELERLTALGEADLDAPTDRLREPIAAYNDAVSGAVEQFKRETPAREVLETLADLRAFPLVPVDAPPADLHDYVREHEAGTEPIPTLLEYADYSRSKLSHYVGDADALKRAVSTRRTYLRRLDAAPLRIDWPPPPADRLEWRCAELTSAVNRIAPEAVEKLRAVAALAREPDYGRLREAAVARAELTAEERERLRSGAVTEELDDARGEHERLTAALSDYPER
jgi:hypothetical protein